MVRGQGPTECERKDENAHIADNAVVFANYCDTEVTGPAMLSGECQTA